MRKRFSLVSAAVGLTLMAAACGSSSKTTTPPSLAGAAKPPTSAGAAKPPTSAECVKAFGVACYSPKQLQRAYDLAPLYAKGFDGKGRTIVIIDPYGSPTLARDLATFDHALGLPAPRPCACCSPSEKCPPSAPPVPRWSQRPAKRRAT
jgi:subtilase family serine protease